ncbi:MAG: SRPBCC domain-containing protein [Polyangiaceae bacterium]
MTTRPTADEPQVRIERTFDFPRAAVWDAWTSPERLARWFAPRGCTLTFERIDVRPGGGFHSRLEVPDFGECWTVAEIVELVPPERLAFVWRIADAKGEAVSPQSQGHDPEWPFETRVTVTLEELGARTRLVLTQTVSEALAKRTGAHPSWLQMLDILGETLASGAA